MRLGNTMMARGCSAAAAAAQQQHLLSHHISSRCSRCRRCRQDTLLARAKKDNADDDDEAPSTSYQNSLELTIK